jgi:hypothetical protein
MTDVGDQLAASFLKGVKNANWGRNCSLALYVEEPNCTVPGRFLRRIGFATGALVEDGPLEPPPLQVDMRGQRGLYLHSWWGDTGIAVCNPDEFNERARAEGMLDGEFVAATIPFRGPGEAEGTPWGVLRVGILEHVPEVAPGGNLVAFRNLIARGNIEMLHTLVNVEQ